MGDEKQWAVAMKDKLAFIHEQAAKKKGGSIEVEPDFYPPGHGSKKKSSCACVTQIRCRFFELIMHPQFDNVMTGCILGNMIVMAATYYDQESWYESLLDILNSVFTYIFIVEFVMKHIGLGMRQYWGDTWNRLDGTLVLISIAGIAAGGITTFSLLRSLRVLRVLRLIKGVPGLRSIATTLYLSIPSLGNVGIMLLLILYVYAVLGMNLFFEVKHQQHITKDVNFETFW